VFKESYKLRGLNHKIWVGTRQRRAEFHCGHIHFEDKLGRFGGGMEDIDPRLVDSSADFWTMERAGYWARLGKVFTNPDVFEYRSYGDTHRLNARPLGIWWADGGGHRIEQIASPQRGGEYASCL